MLFIINCFKKYFIVLSIIGFYLASSLWTEVRGMQPPEPPNDMQLIQRPRHIAFICDGNRRWAQAKSLPPFEGHASAANTVAPKILKSMVDLEIHTITLWLFAPSNWQRPIEEVDKLMDIGEKFVKDITPFCLQKEVKVIHLGRKDRIPSSFAEEILRAENRTMHFNKHIFNMAIDYDGRDEIIRALKKMSVKNTDINNLQEDGFSDFLDTANQPYPNPDLVIRTSGEQRLSGFMPWQTKDTELYFIEKHFPDLDENDLQEAISAFCKRNRRLGK